MVKRNCIKTPKKKAEKIRKILIEKKALDQDKKVKKKEGKIIFPLKENTNPEKIKKELQKEVKVVKEEIKSKNRKPKSLKQALKEKFNEEEMKKLVTSFDIIGKIAVLEIPEELQEKEKEIGKAIMKVHPNVETVCKRERKTKGRYRIRKVYPIAGKEKTETTHKEHGVRIKVDLNKSYFNPRLSREREIIADKVKDDEKIGYLFAGTGPFGLVIAEKNKEKNIDITAVELNPDAYEYLEENILLNGFTEKIEPVHKDVKKLKGYEFDRAIMTMPIYSEEYLDSVLKNTSEEAIIHYYSLGKEPNYYEKPKQEIERHIEKFEILDKREVLSYAPGKKEVVLDVKLLS